jgi:hypothetical protein
MRMVETKDLIDENVWARLGKIVKAAHDLNREEFAILSRAFSREVNIPGQQKAGLYLWYLLRHALAKVAGGLPSASDLSRISGDYVANFSAVVEADRSILEDTFRKVFELSPLVKEIGPGDLLVLGSAALGVLSEDSDEELARMKPGLNRWWASNSESFHNQGLRR